MTRIALRHTLSILAAVALIYAFVARPVSAQSTGGQSSSCSGISHCGAMGLMQLSPGTAEPQTPKGLATKKGPQAAHRFSATPSEIALPNSGAGH